MPAVPAPRRRQRGGGGSAALLTPLREGEAHPEVGFPKRKAQLLRAASASVLARSRAPRNP